MSQRLEVFLRLGTLDGSRTPSMRPRACAFTHIEVV